MYTLYFRAISFGPAFSAHAWTQSSGTLRLLIWIHSSASGWNGLFVAVAFMAVTFVAVTFFVVVTFMAVDFALALDFFMALDLFMTFFMAVDFMTFMVVAFVFLINAVKDV